MQIDPYALILGLLSTLIAIGGWYIKQLDSNISHLQRKDDELLTKINEIHILVAGEYVKRDEFRTLSDKIDKLLDKLEKKADKP